MKIRTGFVSNSSSSSFCLMGICIDIEEIKKLDYFKNEFKNFAKENYPNDYEFDEDSDDYDDFVKENFSEIGGVKTEHNYDSDEYYIGLYAQDIKENETLSQFKERVKKTISDNMGMNVKKVAWHEDCWWS